MKKLRSAACIVGVAALIACGGSSDDASSADGGAGDGSAGSPGGPQSDGGGAGDGATAKDSGGGISDGGDVDGSSHVAPGSCGGASPAKGFIPSTSVKVGTATRTYALTVPATYDGTKIYPLVVGFHGDGGTGAGYRGQFAIEAAAGANAIFVWPDGTNNNDGHSFDQEHDPPANADVSFFDAILTQIAASYCIDTNKIWIHGFSGGAYFANQLGRWRQTVVKAVGAQSGGGPFGNQNSDFDNMGNVTITGPVPAIMVHGLSDGTVDISEGMKSLTYWRSADKSTSGQAATSPSPCEKQNGGVAPVIFCAIPGMDHTIWTSAPTAIWGFYTGL